MKYCTILLFSVLLAGCDIGFHYIAKPEHGDLMRETLSKIDKCESIDMDAYVYGGWVSDHGGRERVLYYNVVCQEKKK